MQTIKDALNKLQSGGVKGPKQATSGCLSCVQFKVRENNLKKGEPVFVREDGKIGFPTINSLDIKIGDVVSGEVKLDADTYFMFEVQEIVSSS